MRRSWFCIVIAAEALVFILLGFLQIRFSETFSAVAAFPFEQIGLGLRKLSLSGPAGNVLAIILYGLFSLIPCAVYGVLRRKHRETHIDLLLILLSVLLFVVNYYMINPGLLQTGVPASGKWMLGSVFYSVLFGYLVLRLLHIYSKADVKKLQQGLQILLGFLNVVFVYAACGQEFGTLLSSIQTVQSGNSSSGIEGGFIYDALDIRLTYLFLVLRFLINVLPYILDIAVVFLSLRVLKELMADRYSDGAVNAVQKLAEFCAVSLGITVIADMAFNVLQLICSRRLYQMNFTVHIPVVPIVFVLAVMLLVRYVRENQKLKQEHDLFI